MRCNDLKIKTVQQFPQIGKKITFFKELCFQFMLEFQRSLVRKLPSVGEGGEEEAVLAENLKTSQASPFNINNLNEWMECKEREIYTLKSFIQTLKNT